MPQCQLFIKSTTCDSQPSVEIHLINPPVGYERFIKVAKELLFHAPVDLASLTIVKTTNYLQISMYGNLDEAAKLQIERIASAEPFNFAIIDASQTPAPQTWAFTSQAQRCKAPFLPASAPVSRQNSVASLVPKQMRKSASTVTFAAEIATFHPALPSHRAQPG